jgi:hypothetical protein
MMGGGMQSPMGMGAAMGPAWGPDPLMMGGEPPCTAVDPSLHLVWGVLVSASKYRVVWCGEYRSAVKASTCTPPPKCALVCWE